MTEGNGGPGCIYEECGEGLIRAVNILNFLNRRERVISDEFFEFIPMGLFERLELECRSAG